MLEIVSFDHAARVVYQESRGIKILPVRLSEDPLIQDSLSSP